jgi:RNA polymerase sigma factor (sigma-70 family)
LSKITLGRRYLEENSQLLIKFIEKELTGTQKCYIIKYYIDGKTIREIADEYGVYPSTVSRTVNRAKAKIYRALETARELCG